MMAPLFLSWFAETKIAAKAAMSPVMATTALVTKNSLPSGLKMPLVATAEA
jgi:hypothetical protein